MRIHEEDVNSFSVRDEAFKYMLRLNIEALEETRNRIFGSSDLL